MSGSIYAKISKVTDEVSVIPKNGYNGHFNYNYVREDDIIEMVRPILVKHGLVYVPNVVEQQRNGEFTKVNLEFTLADVDSGETLKSNFWGEGQDKNDKGLYKAYTGATKYFLMKTFQIGSGDDPEQSGLSRQGNQKGKNPQGNGQRPPQGQQQGNGQRPHQGQQQGNGQRPPQGQQQGNGQRPSQGQLQGNDQRQSQVRPQEQGYEIYTGKVKLTADAETDSELTPEGLLPRVRIYGMSMDNRQVLLEGWGSEMLPLMSDLIAGQTVMVQGAKAKANSQQILRIALTVSNFAVTSSAA